LVGECTLSCKSSKYLCNGLTSTEFDGFYGCFETNISIENKIECNKLNNTQESY